MEKEPVTIVDDLVTNCIKKFTDAGYMVYIYPMPKDSFCVMVTKIGVGGGHYVAKNLEDCFVSLLNGQQEYDENLCDLVAKQPSSS